MGSKNISIKEDVVKYLDSLKSKDESYSDVILKLKERRGTNGPALLQFMNDHKINVDWTEQEKNIKEFRDSFEKGIQETIKYMEEARRKK